MGLHTATTFSGPQLLPLAGAAAAVAQAGGVVVVAGTPAAVAGALNLKSPVTFGVQQ